MKVVVYPKKIKGKQGYDIFVRNENATLQDYLDALKAYIENDRLIRGDSFTSCKGCDRCCRERIPLTCIDVFKMLEVPEVQSSLTGNKPEILEFLEKFTHVCVEGPVVDISFGRKVNGACIWLDEEERICKNYNYRSLVCQTYICLPASKKAEQLRSLIVNLGMDELVRVSLHLTEEAGVPFAIHEGYDVNISREDWEVNPFTGKNDYNEILLKDICDESLWSQLCNYETVK